MAEDNILPPREENEALKMIVGKNHDHQVVIQFSHEILIAQFSPEEAIGLGQALIKHAKELQSTIQ